MICLRNEGSCCSSYSTFPCETRVTQKLMMSQYNKVCNFFFLLLTKTHPCASWKCILMSRFQVIKVWMTIKILYDCCGSCLWEKAQFTFIYNARRTIFWKFALKIKSEYINCHRVYQVIVEKSLLKIHLRYKGRAPRIEMLADKLHI